MQKCAKKQSYFFTIAFLITFCCVLINKLSFYTDCPKIPELVKQCFSNLSMSKCLIVSALSSAFPNDFPIFCVYRLIKSIYLQKCTAPDKLRTVHFFLKFYDFSIFYIRSYGFNFLQIISFRIIHTTTKTATKAPSNSNSVYYGADCMAYKFG